MRGHTIFLVAAFALPLFAAPTSMNEALPRDQSAIERRASFSLSNLFRDVLKRAPTVEPIPSSASYDVAIEKKGESSSEILDEANDPSRESIDSDLDKRQSRTWTGHGGGKRTIEERQSRTWTGHGGGKRALEERQSRTWTGHGGGKRALEERQSRTWTGHGGGKRSVVEQVFDSLFG